MMRRLQIGAFARLTGIPVKTLRYYAEEGLLEPDFVDPSTAYRYYSQVQVGDARRILNLRLAGLSLSDIRRLNLEDPGISSPQLSAALRAQHQRLHREKARIDAQIGAVRLLREALDKIGPEALSDLTIRIVEPEFAFIERASSKSGDVNLTPLFERAEAIVAKVDARADRAPFSIFDDRANDEAEELVCIPVRDDALDRIDAELVGETHLAVSATFQGPYVQTPVVRRKINDFLCAMNVKLIPLERTVYHRFGADENGYVLPTGRKVRRSRDFLTEVQVPIQFPKG